MNKYLFVGIILGTLCNSICILSGIGSDDDKTNISLNHLVSGHTGKVKKIAVHPIDMIFATVSADKSLRMWDYGVRRQIATWKVVGSACCVSFSPKGDALAVGNAAGDLTLTLTHSLYANEITYKNPSRLSISHTHSLQSLWQLL